MSKKYNVSKQGTSHTDKLHGFSHALLIAVFLVLFFLSVVSIIGFSAQSVAPSDSRIIEFSIERERRSIPTRAKTVGEFLDKIEVKLGRYDIVEPSVDTVIDDEKFHINVYRARPITIVEPGKERKFAYSAATTPRSVVRQAGVEVYPEDRIESKLPDNFLKEGVLGEKVVIERSVPANINLYGSHVPVRTHARTVGELLEEKSIALADKDEVKPSPDTPIKSDMQIFVIRSGTKLVTTHEEIPMPTETVEDPQLSFGVQVVRQEGSPGKKAITYQVILENGKEVGRKKIQEVVSVEPVKHIIAKGKAVYIPEDRASIMRAAGIPQSDFPYAEAIINRENGLWCPTRWQGQAHCPAFYEEKYPGAENDTSLGYGLCQSTPAVKMSTAGSDWRTNAVTQMKWCSEYAAERYGSWRNAYQFWQNNHWW